MKWTKGVSTILSFLNFILVLLAAPLGVSYALESPYIYYYSIPEHAFVVEQVDGSNRRILAPFTLPSVIDSAGNGFLVGPGWSASGEWFAWSYSLANGIPGVNAFLVNRTGTDNRQLVDGSRATPEQEMAVANLSWHPIEDLLMIYLTARSEIRNYIQIYSPERNEVILEIDVNEIIGGAFNIQEISWSPAGDYILIWNTRNVKILNLEGNVVSTLAMTISYNEGSYAECGIDNLPHWLDEHTIAYTDAEKSRFIIQNVETEYRLFDINVPADKARLVDFAPDQAQLLLYTVDSADIRNQTYSVWYISLEDGTAVPLQEDTPFPSGCDDRAFYTSAWRDSSLVRFVMDDGGIALFSPQNQNVSRVPLPAEGVNHHYTPLRWGNDQLIYMWFNSHLPSSMSIYSYNLANGETTLLVDGQVIDLPAGVNYFSPINRGRFLASSFLVSVVDGSIREIPELNQQDGDLPQEVQWHPSGEWFFMLESSVGYGLQGVHVVGTETEQQRYITACLHDSQSCFGWLPETD